MLIDTGCSLTMVAADKVNPETVDHAATERMMCVHSDSVPYPTATVRLRLGEWEKTARVAVVPNLPVDVLLGTDVYRQNLDVKNIQVGFGALTRAQRQWLQLEKPSSPEAAIDPVQQKDALAEEQGTGVPAPKAPVNILPQGEVAE